MLRARVPVLPAAFLLSAACGPSASLPRTAADPGPSGSPLGPSYVLLPLPGEDDSLLGRILPAAPEPGRSLEEIARPNPCADKLGPPRPTPLASTFEDVQELSSGARARAALGVFGFEGDVEQATHFVYKLETSKRLARTDTNEYVTCCKQAGCGYGYVSALVFGEGEYATGSDTRVAGGVEVAVAGASGHTRLRILHKRKVRGWLAALVTVTDHEHAARLGPLGPAIAGLGEDSLSDQVKARYEPEKIRMEFMRDTSGAPTYALRDGRSFITENEFVRRFQGLTGSADLDGAKARRNTGSVVVMGVLAGASVATLVWGVTHLSQPCTAQDPIYSSGCNHTHVSGNQAPPPGYAPAGDGYWYDPGGSRTSVGGVVATTVGGVTTFVFGVGLLGALLLPDGTPLDHSLTDREAHPFVQRYNRTLLRKSIRDVDSVNRGARLAPPIVPAPAFGLGPGTIGLSGSF